MDPKRKRSSYREVNPHDIRPLHAVDRPMALEELVESMQARGWVGQPLLVIERTDGSLQAWTGSHRIQAARDVGLATVPCYIVREWKLVEISADALWGHSFDHHRLKLIRKTKDAKATELMEIEVWSNRKA